MEALPGCFLGYRFGRMYSPMMSGVWKRCQGRASEAPPDERGGNRYVQPAATAPHSDSTNSECSPVTRLTAGMRRERPAELS